MNGRPLDVAHGEPCAAGRAPAGYKHAKYVQGASSSPDRRSGLYGGARAATGKDRGYEWYAGGF